MNFYTVAAKMDKSAMKQAQEEYKRYQLARERCPDIKLPNDPPTIDELYDKYFKLEEEKFDKICNIGVDLMFKFKNKISALGDTSGDRWYFITVRPPNGVTWDLFKRNCEDFCAKWLHKWIEFEYVFEQKGKTEETIGHGFHWHMRICTTHINYYKTHILRDLFRMFPYVAENCIKVEPIKSLERTIEYMQGDKKDKAKEAACKMDILWRERLGLPASVKYNTRQAIEDSTETVCDAALPDHDT